MPNWCDNTLNITGTSESIKQIVQALRANNFNLYETFIPYVDRSSWGTKWEVDNGTLEALIEQDYTEGDDFLNVWFDTAWGPNLPVSEAIASKHGVEITHKYEESGNAIMGIAHIDSSGDCYDEEFDTSDIRQVVAFHDGMIPDQYLALTKPDGTKIIAGDLLYRDDTPFGVLVSEESLLPVGMQVPITVGEIDGVIYFDEYECGL